MPLYEFRCQACGQRFEQLCQSWETAGEVRCPQCRSPRVGRLFSTFAVSVKGGKPRGSTSSCSGCSASSCRTCRAR